MKSWVFEFNLRRPHKTASQQAPEATESYGSSGRCQLIKQAKFSEEEESKSGVSSYTNPNHAYMSRKEEDSSYISYSNSNQQKQARYGNNSSPMKGGIGDGYYSQALPYQAHSNHNHGMMSKEEYQAQHMDHAGYQVQHRRQTQPNHAMPGKGGLYSSYGNGTSHQSPQYLANVVRKVDPCSCVPKEVMSSNGYHHEEEYGSFSSQSMMFQNHGMEREEDLYAGKAMRITGYY